ncbi:DUF1540 domain-containing protein [Tepidibacter formicigenes]|jgi:hypothetical protein|uniref:DUF1540 domain-containing protein n=1 Tax=Tepidibacter formicigenes DSM 15518 TaxID=1123349 RepID=A0A1M6JZ08_9FIRM|nr:DUF1540 domain-containing protein [Tepidibacter formicigenes]SHJ51923.1 protein of unknown function [Tepidibacter formicigenes DSM 15518]
MNINMSNQPISRVECSVETCHYNDGKKHCLAPSIQIKAQRARTIQETDCLTFTPKHTIK